MLRPRSAHQRRASRDRGARHPAAFEYFVPLISAAFHSSLRCRCLQACGGISIAGRGFQGLIHCAHNAMNIHEYQAKELLEKFGVATTRGKVASTPDEAEAIARELGKIDIVVKAQVHAGGRGKGTFKNGFKGGVHLVKLAEEAREVAEKMLGQTLVTHQTGPAGRVVRKVLIAESAEIAREIYFAILRDRPTAAPLIVASTEGGVDIESVAANSPEKIIRQGVDPLAGLQPFQTRKLAKQLGFEHSQTKAATKLFDGLYRTFIGCDCALVEINPLVVTKQGEVLALDAKFDFDDNALYRHPDIAAMRDTGEEDPREVEASKHGR